MAFADGYFQHSCFPPKNYIIRKLVLKKVTVESFVGLTLLHLRSIDYGSQSLEFTSGNLRATNMLSAGIYLYLFILS